MKRTTLWLAALLVSVAGVALADYGVSDKGDWPATWPKEMEPLRKQARTLTGPLQDYRHYAITFTKREEVEAAWPHLLAAKTKGAPIYLVRGHDFFLGDKTKAGVVIHCPPADSDPSEKEKAAFVAKKDWLKTNYLVLVVDGEIVDLNRLPFPADTPIIDSRFKEEKK